MNDKSIEYKKLKEILRNIGELYFNMALVYVIDNGINQVKQWSDEDITEAEVPGLFAEDTYRLILKSAREIAQNTNPIDLALFCMTEGTLDPRNYSGKLQYNKLEKMLKLRIGYEDYGFNRKEEIDYLCRRYGCMAEDFEALGFKIPDEYWEEGE